MCYGVSRGAAGRLGERRLESWKSRVSVLNAPGNGGAYLSTAERWSWLRQAIQRFNQSFVTQSYGTLKGTRLHNIADYHGLKCPVIVVQIRQLGRDKRARPNGGGNFPAECGGGGSKNRDSFSQHVDSGL